MAATQTTETTTSYDCAKCDGRGRINGFQHIASGRCFQCGGSGKVELAALTDGDIERAHYYMGNSIKSMFLIGTEDAREVLDYISTGKWWSIDAWADVQAPRAEAAELRQWVIARGREMRAAA
jgi:hypothetical protein